VERRTAPRSCGKWCSLDGDLRRAGGVTCTCGACASTGIFLKLQHHTAPTPSTRPKFPLVLPSRSPAMVRHKKDNFSRGGKKSSNPRPRPVPRGDGDDAAPSSRPAFRAACWDMGHCDPKRCSGKRLMKLGLMRELHIGQRFPGVIVSYAPTPPVLRVPPRLTCGF
jgi:hypothetical protein